MKVNATKLRASIYRILDASLESGKPVEVERKGRLLKIEPVNAPSKLSRLKKRKIMTKMPESYISNDWSKEWRHNLP